MSLTRRKFLSHFGWLTGGTMLPIKANANSVHLVNDWHSVRMQFNLSSDYIHLACFYISSHPKPVRKAIEKYRDAIDRNPFLTVDRGMFGEMEERMPARICEAAAAYAGGQADQFAITSNTTTSLALIYNGLVLRPGQEILTTEHDHYSHHESIRLAVEKFGATWRKIALFQNSLTVSVEEIVERLTKSIRPNTRVVGLTWVHSSTGVRLPIREIAKAIREINLQREASNHLLLVVDGVHGFGAVDESLPDMGCDFFAAGTHKWLFAPRGTGILWGRDSAWRQLRPTIPTFVSAEPYTAWQQGHPPRGDTRADWVTPGGFYAYEHQWAMIDAFQFHQKIGRARVAARLAELNGQCKEGLAKMSHVTLHTPRSAELSAGIICFEVAGYSPQAVVEKLLKRRIIASTSPYATSYVRFSFGIMNTLEEVEQVLKAVHDLG
jgi:isopenicillin-N epimerase